MSKILTFLNIVFTLGFVTACAQEEEKNNAAEVEKLKDIEAVIKTKAGDIKIKLYASKTPVTVANFCNLEPINLLL